MLRQEDTGIDNVSTWEDKMEAKTDRMEAHLDNQATLNKILEVLEVVTRQRALNSAVETPPETPPVSRVRRLGCGVLAKKYASPPPPCQKKGKKL